jgi:segregation and condensation protein B
MLETLALIAYRQPITRGEIEEIRGVSVSSNIVKSLTERNWVKVIGHKEVPGRPALLATTKTFLDYFSLSSLADLPSAQMFEENLQMAMDAADTDAPNALGGDSTGINTAAEKANDAPNNEQLH